MRYSIGAIFAQYAGARGPAARVEIVRTRDHERSGRKPQRLHLPWSETNGPPVRAPAKRNFGTRLIETLGHRLKGRQAGL
jgi:two-component sensor histidine kinase